MFELPHVLASKYRLLRRVGEGGMGVVYAGDHLELKTRVAIKVLQPKLVEDSSARARFLREARLAASIEGEHSTRIHDVGTDDAGRPYIVMEFLAGEPADARLARERKLSVGDAATLLVQLLDALAEAHAKGLVHRDLKPANVFLAERPGEAIWVKVLDFGISKVTSQEISPTTPSPTLTEPRTLLGSPHYMSPEQLRDSTAVDARSDLWSCGVLLYELVSGDRPFEASSLADLYAAIVSGAPRPLAAGVPAPIARAIERCLRKDASERPQSAYELAAMVAPFASESARTLLPRIRAWCKSDEALGDGTRSRRALAGGLALVAVAGALGFAAASYPERGAAPALSTAQATAIRALDPVSPASAAPLPAASTSGSVEPPPTAPAPSASARARPANSPPAPPKKRIQDLDGIELIQ